MTAMRGSEVAKRISIELGEVKTRHDAIEEILDAFGVEDGNAVRAARHLGVSHRALMRWVSSYPILVRRVRSIRRGMQADRGHAKMIAHPKTGVVRSISGWAKELGLTRQAVHQRIRDGWDLERALTQGTTR